MPRHNRHVRRGPGGYLRPENDAVYTPSPHGPRRSFGPVGPAPDLGEAEPPSCPDSPETTAERLLEPLLLRLELLAKKVCELEDEVALLKKGGAFGARPEGAPAKPAHAGDTGPRNKPAPRDTRLGAEPAHTRGAPAEPAHTGGAPAELAHTGSAPAEPAHTGSAPAEPAHTRGASPGGKAARRDTSPGAEPVFGTRCLSPVPADPYVVVAATMTYVKRPREEFVLLTTPRKTEVWLDFNDVAIKWVPRLAKANVPTSVTVRLHTGEDGDVYFSNPMLFGTIGRMDTTKGFGFLRSDALDKHLYFGFNMCDPGTRGRIRSGAVNAQTPLWFRVATSARGAHPRFWATRVSEVTPHN